VIPKTTEDHGSSDGSGPGTGGSPTGVGARDRWLEPIIGQISLTQKPYDDIPRESYLSRCLPTNLKYTPDFSR
jgi:hypothetical protein